MASTSEIIKAMDAEYGKGITSMGVPIAMYDRVPTGFLDLDLGTGGGFPRGKASIVYGPEGSGKTTIILKAIANHQKLWPDQKCVFIDAEGHYDEAWAKLLGVDNDSLIYVLPETAEQIVDIVEAFLHADDVGIVAVDSLAAMITQNETTSSAEKAVVGGTGLAIGKLYRKATRALNSARRAGRLPTLLCINQIRFKIGVTHGDPETMPGGASFKFFSSLTLRVYGKDVEEKKIHPTLPAWKVISIIVKKKKIPTVKRNMEVKMAIVANPQVAIASSYDWPTISRYLKEFNLLDKAKKASDGWVFNGETYKTQDLLKNRIMTDYAFEQLVVKKIFSLVLNGYDDSEEEIDPETGEVLDINTEEYADESGE